jgi:Rubrerythrin
MRNFDSLSERETLALAISLEEADEQIYADFAEGLRQDFPASAVVFDGMQDEESGHRRRLIELEADRRLFVLQIVQPGLAGLVDVRVHTRAGIRRSVCDAQPLGMRLDAGLGASIAAGISMGFAEALSDDGSLTGRGHPWVRGFIVVS